MNAAGNLVPRQLAGLCDEVAAGDLAAARRRHFELFELNQAIFLDTNPMLGMVWTFAAGGKIFVYQSAVLVVGYSHGYFDNRDMLKVGLTLTLVESIILLFLVPFYWPLIGIG